MGVLDGAGGDNGGSIQGMALSWTQRVGLLPRAQPWADHLCTFPITLPYFNPLLPQGPFHFWSFCSELDSKFLVGLSPHQPYTCC